MWPSISSTVETNGNACIWKYVYLHISNEFAAVHKQEVVPETRIKS